MLSQAIDPIHFFVRSYHARMHAYVDRPRRPIFDFMIRAAESPVWRPVCDRHLYEAALNRVHLLLEVSKKRETRDGVPRLPDCLFQVFQPRWRSKLVQYAAPGLKAQEKSGCQISTDPSGETLPS